MQGCGVLCCCLKTLRLHRGPQKVPTSECGPQPEKCVDFPFDLTVCPHGCIQVEKGDSSPHVNGESLDADSEDEDSDELEEDNERGTEQQAAFPAEENRMAKEGVVDGSRARKVI